MTVGFRRRSPASEFHGAGGDVGAASEALKLPKKTLYDRLRRLGLPIESFR